jgi:hypothetical protein
MTIDITPEAVEHLCKIHEGYEQHGTVATLRALSAALNAKQDDAYLRGFSSGTKVAFSAGTWTTIDIPELADLSAALTASQAETAAAYEVAALAAENGLLPLIAVECASVIRAITPADIKTALDRMIAEARAEGRDKGMREAASIADEKYALGDMGNPGHHILAAIPKGGE